MRNVNYQVRKKLTGLVPILSTFWNALVITWLRFMTTRRMFVALMLYTCIFAISITGQFLRVGQWKKTTSG
ncbi:hypothetical protein Mm0Y_03832 [Morganella morganii]|nr:hypothetical protein Mm0Y_03832 [Morganella morganii]